jgi:hypothetical protein
MSDFHRLALIAALFVGITTVAQPTRVNALPTDLCALLPAAGVSKTLGQTYDAPQESVAPRPFPGTNTGTDCNYESKGANGKLWFRIYVDPSAPAATDLFAKLKLYYSPPTAVPKLGDEAYLDPQHALHVRKGKVRFYLNLSPVGDATATEKQLESLAGQVIGGL